MILDMTRPSLKMISVRNACSDAPPSPKRDEAREFYNAAEEARHDMREAETNNWLDAAMRALA